MSYCIFHTESTKFFRIFRKGYWQNAIYADEGSAKAQWTRLVRAGKLNPETHSIMSMEDFRKIEKTETVISLMSGFPVVQSVNTPLCCDPSSETYWSM